MCEQCNANPIGFGEPIPGWFLMRARRDGHEWKRGQWGLVWQNDPSFTWTSTPTPDPLFHIREDSGQRAWFDLNPIGSPAFERTMASVPDDFAEAFRTDPGTGYELVKAAMTKGYDSDRDGDFSAWFFDYLGEHLKDAEMTEVNSEAFPGREALHPSDLTIGRD